MSDLSVYAKPLIYITIVVPSFVCYEATNVENLLVVDYQDHAGHRANVTRVAGRHDAPAPPEGKLDSPL